METKLSDSISVDFLFLTPLPECGHSYLYLDKEQKWGQCHKCFIVRDFELELFLCSVHGTPSKIVTSYLTDFGGHLHLGVCCFDPLCHQASV
jgi:hypothetical protein